MEASKKELVLEIEIAVEKLQLSLDYFYNIHDYDSEEIRRGRMWLNYVLQRLEKLK